MSSAFRCLLVEDDATFRDRLARALASRGLRIIGADGLTAAREVWLGQDLEGAIVDLRLRDGSGIRVIEELHAAQPRVPIIVLTGYGSIATALEAIRSGAADYLTKPVDPDRLVAVLRGEPVPGESRVGTPPELPSLDRVEWEHIQRVLAECGGNISRTARLLGLDRRTLQRKLGKFPPHR